MRQVDQNRIEKLLKNVDGGFIPKELIVSANIKNKYGEDIFLTPDEYEEMMLRNIEVPKIDEFEESDFMEMRMMLDLEKINILLKKYSTPIMNIFK